MKTNKIKTAGFIAIIALSITACAPTTNCDVKGCMNSEVANFNSSATQDDVGCVVIQQQQYSLFYKYTATYCGFCGCWGGDANYLHHNVMKSHVTDVFGDAIASGSIAAGKVYNLGFVFPYTDIPNLDFSKMDVV